MRPLRSANSHYECPRVAVGLRGFFPQLGVGGLSLADAGELELAANVRRDTQHWPQAARPNPMQPNA